MKRSLAAAALLAGLGLMLVGCGGPAGEDCGTGGNGTGGADGSGGVPGSGGAGTGGNGTGGASTGGAGTGGTGTGGSATGGAGTGGTNTGEIDIYDLGTSCDAGSCPTGLTPTYYEICGIISCETECDCHLLCADDPEICPEGSECTYAAFIDDAVCVR